MAVVHGATQTAVAAVAAGHPQEMGTVRPLTVALLVGIALVWGGLDGWLRRPDAGMNWFYACLIGGVVAGILGVVGQASFVDQTGVSALGSALTAGAAFTALLILLPAGLGVAVGSRLETPGRKAASDEPASAEAGQ
jgi:hypothetical protein